MYLPAISAFFSLLVAILPLTPVESPAPPPRAASQQEGAVTVLAGTGDVAADQVARVRTLVDEELPRLRKVFGERPLHAFAVFVHEGSDSLPPALAAVHHPDSPGFALLGQHQIHLLLAEMRKSGKSVRGVVVHELVHELLDQYTAPHGRRIPRWFHEGLAQVLAGDTYLGASEEDLVWRLGADRLPSFGELRDTFPGGEHELRLAYAQSYSYVAWLLREFGLDELLAVARATDDLTPFERALSGRVGRTSMQLMDGWRGYVVHGSGAPWRVAFDQCFTLLIIAALPVLALALMRRLSAEQRAARQLREREAAQPPVDGAANAPADAPANEDRGDGDAEAPGKTGA